MSQRKLAFVFAPEVETLSYPPDCPFKTERAALTRARLESLGLLNGEGSFELRPVQASPEQLLRFHTPAYVEELTRSNQGELSARGFEMGLGGPDTPVFRGMLDYGTWACGAALRGAEALLAGEADVAFSLLGGFHHAMAAKAAGFCYLNDVVLACQQFVAAGKRVAYVDVDAHHGDGVQEAFYRSKDVLTISLHESGHTLFPWGGFEDEIGEGAGRGFNVNVPLPAWTYDEAFLNAIQSVAFPLLRAYCPDVVVLELGMDTLAGDPLTHLQLTNNVVVELIEDVLALNKPLLVTGGGGYHVDNTVRGWALAWRTCRGEAQDDLWAAGLGGVMLESVEWAGGLRDRALPVTPEQRRAVLPELANTLSRLQTIVFPLHGLEQQVRSNCNCGTEI